MSSLLLLVLVAAPVVKAPPDAEVVVFVPRLDGLAKVLPFFEAAGTRSAVLRPDTWRDQAFPLLAVDVTNGESVAAAGFDPTGSLTTSTLGDRTISCVGVADPKRYQARVAEKLARLGTPFTQTEGGLAISAARDPINRVLAAVVTQGRESCAMVGNGLSVEKQLGALVKALKDPLKTPQLKETPGPIAVLVNHGAQRFTTGVNTKGLVLTVDLRATGLALATLQGAGPSPLGAFAAEGVLTARARFAKSAMPALLEQVVHRVPTGAELAKAVAVVAPRLTGNTALLVSHVKVTSGLRTPAARFFAVRFALLAETTDAEAVKGALAALDPKALSMREGTLSLTIEGNVVVLSNDDEVKRKALAALASAAGTQAHALEVHITPPLLAKALAQVPLLEVVQTPELAQFLAASAELGPLLLASERADGWLDPVAAGHRGQLTWSLDPAKFTPDAGAP
jgi:hypothetical protein